MRTIEILEEKNIACKYFVFRGSSRGRSNGFPIEIGEYNTVNYGWLSNFKLGNYCVGDWILVFEKYSSGDAATPSFYRAVYVKEDDYIKAKEILSKHGKKVTDVPLPAVEERKKELKEKVLNSLDNLSLEKLTKIAEIIEEV